MAKRSGASGGRELSAALKALVATVAPALNGASKRSLEPVLDAARANLAANGSIVTGRLRKILVIKRDGDRSSKLKPVYSVGPDGSDPHYRTGHLVEFGSAPHFQPKLNRVHPGAAARPFLRPAFDAEKQTVVKRFAAEIGPALERQARRLEKRAAKRKGGT